MTTENLATETLATEGLGTEGLGMEGFIIKHVHNEGLTAEG
jgi:hypothetical protein